MNALLNATDPNNRLIEALGSAALFSDTSSASSPLGLPLNALDLAGITDTAVDTAQPGSATQLATSPDIAALFGAADGHATLTDSLPLDHVVGGLPIVGNNETGDILSGLDLGNLGLGSLNLGNIGHGGEAPGASPTPLDLAGSGTTLQPVFDAANVLIKDVHYELEILSHQTGTNDVLHALTGLGETVGLGVIGMAPTADGSSNLITDTLNLPGDILSGNLDGGIANIGHDLTDTIHATTGLVNSVLNGNDPSNPVPELINGIGSSLQHLPLLTANGGNSGDNGLLGGIVGDISHSSSGHLIDIDVGPQQSNGLVLDVLSATGSDAGHTVSLNAIDVGPNGPHLVDLGVLTGSNAADGLAGNVLGGHGVPGGDLLGGVTGGASNTTAVTTIVTEVVDIVPAAGGGDHGLLNLHGTHIL